MKRNQYDCIRALETAGISFEDAAALRRISMTLRRWFELECGTDRGAIEREGENSDGRPYWNSAYTRNMATVRRYVPDREAGARKRLAKIMARYPNLSAYVQTDPRGAALYILRKEDIPDGDHALSNMDSYYSRGICVCQ